MNDTLTTTGGSDSIYIGGNAWPSYAWPGSSWPGRIYYQPASYEREVEPTSCMGKAHVFECDQDRRGALQRRP